ncbi:MAG: DUF262 domain-containing protein [Candidatus Eisenbacteria bacterium]|uniref:DUF262 domain-containing protein n=1 Tax=Eiseniibacteriota bacterium TaxID=2212470 RepID=A0A933SBF7_UNCEI|nr:DUF262 domain-containing protein [Candidatus Eisenbacteria bacterium]
MGKAISQTNSKSIQALFKSFYVVPDFQREYVWKRQQVRQLLVDLKEARDSNNQDTYFLGSIVVFQDGPEKYSLVDGQQRLTTLYVLFCAIRDRIRHLDPNGDIDFLTACIAGTSVAVGGVSERHHRVTMDFEADKRVLEQIGEAKAHEVALKKREAGRPILDAYLEAAEFLDDQYGEDLPGLRSFAYYLLTQVEIIVVETEDFLQALVIFERINDRGLGLSAVDLLKNLLFKSSSPDQHTKLAKEWRQIIDTLRHGGEKNYLRFLRYFLVAHYNFERMPKAEEVFSWIVEHRDGLGIGRETSRFIQQVRRAAEAYVRMLEGQAPDGGANDYILGIANQGSSVRQHLPILLAGRHLSPTEFRRLSRAMECMTVVFALANAQWNEMERRVPGWCRQLREASTPADVDVFISEQVNQAVREHLPAAHEKLNGTKEMRPGLLKYFLARLAQTVDRECGKDHDLGAYLKAKVTIEHILPQSLPESVVREGFGSVEAAKSYVYRLGNLTLLHSGANAAAQAQPFEDKKRIFERSDYELTRSLVTDIELGRDTKYGKTRTKYGLTPFEVWSAENVEKRQQALVKVMNELWGL